MTDQEKAPKTQNQLYLEREANVRRRSIASDIKYAIRELELLLNSVKNGDCVYSSFFHGSTMTDLPGKIECLRMLEDLQSELV